MADGDLKMVREFFGLNLSEMRAEWVTLSEKDKAEILAGLRDGSLTY